MSSNVPLAYRSALSKYGSGLRLLTRSVSLASLAPTANVILLNDPDRVFWLILNRSVDYVEVHWQDAWTFGQALLLPPNGGGVSMQADEDGEAVSYPVWAEIQTSGGVLFVQEITHS